MRLRLRYETYPAQMSETATSGWAELHKHVRTTDIDKVDDCRDDIDTLLVFVRQLLSRAHSAHFFTPV